MKRISDEEADRIFREHGFEPLEPYEGSNKGRKAMCAKWHITTPALARLRSTPSSGCSKCSHAGGKRRLPAEDVDALFRSYGLEPLEPYVDARAPRKAICVNWHIVAPCADSLKRGLKVGCKECSRVVGGLSRRLPEANLVARFNAYGFEFIGPGTGTRWQLRCGGCGSVVESTIGNVEAGHGCRTCGNLKFSESKRLTQKEAFRRARAAGFEPLEPYRAALELWLCKCVHCGTVARRTMGNMSQGHRCACQVKSFHQGPVPSWVYLLVHPEYDALKVGVSQSLALRTSQHKSNGWDVDSMVLFSYASGREALDVEDAVLREWRREGFGSCLPKGCDGYTETVSLSDVSLEEAIGQIQLASSLAVAA